MYEQLSLPEPFGVEPGTSVRIHFFQAYNIEELITIKGLHSALPTLLSLKSVGLTNYPSLSVRVHTSTFGDRAWGAQGTIGTLRGRLGFVCCFQKGLRHVFFEQIILNRCRTFIG